LVLHFLFYHFLAVIVVIYFLILQQFYNNFMALNSLLCADVPLRNYPLPQLQCYLITGIIEASKILNGHMT